MFFGGYGQIDLSLQILKYSLFQTRNDYIITNSKQIYMKSIFLFHVILLY